MKDRNSGKFSPFSKGDKVWLEARNLKCLYENRKFTLKCEGPFLISEVLSPVTYCLAISLKWKIHNMFHASLLSPYHENNVHSLNYTRPAPDLVQGEEEYEVKAILSHRGSTQNRSYLVHWKGYATAKDSWEPETHLEHAADLLSVYKKAHPKAFPSRTTTHIVSVNCVTLEMAPTCPLPFAHHLRQPAHEQMLHAHRLFLQDSLNCSPMFMTLDPDSPLYLVYCAALQSFNVENIAHYIENDEPNLGLACSVLHGISRELIPDLLQLFDQLGGADLIQNVRDRCTSPTTCPSGGETSSPERLSAAVCDGIPFSSSSSEDSSPTHPVRRHPCPRCNRSSSVLMHVPQGGIRYSTIPIPTPHPPGSPENPICVKSPTEVSAKLAFGIESSQFEEAFQ